MKLLLFVLLLFPSLGRAEDQPCTLSSAQEVLSCVVKRHPDVLRAEAELRSAAALEEAAGQRPNPEVDSEFTAFSDSDQPAAKVEAAYLHTFELGQRRPKRIRQAIARRYVMEARLQRIREVTVLDTVSRLYRLRQLEVETKINHEAIETFGKILQSYKSRARRSPEQEISLSVFGMAHADAELRQSSLEQERTSLESFFQTALGSPLPNPLTVIPSEANQWPSVASTTNLEGAARKEALAALASSESGLAIAQSSTWTDMRVGPRLEMEAGNGQSNQGFGAALSMGLPLYHRNKGARRLAELEVEQAQVHLAQRERELSQERSKWLQIYEKAVTAFKKAPALSDMEQRHQQVDKQFQRGLLSPSLVIEAHRQMAEYAEHRHEQELRAVEALWSIYVLEGRALEVKL